MMGGELMKITRETIEHVANLSRLNLTEQEINKLIGEMENIITFVDKLNELDTSEVPQTAHVLPIKNVFREDISKESFDREKLLANAPSQEGGCLKVPKVVE
jgi:aspartyl-tRNA(Asn)/glutamyl-tRNA(Gln) amidotransferase subunit C